MRGFFLLPLAKANGNKMNLNRGFSPIRSHKIFYLFLSNENNRPHRWYNMVFNT